MKSLFDALNGPPLATFTVDGEKLSTLELLIMEARAQRRALNLIKSRFHPDRLEELVLPEIEASDRRFKSFVATSGGRYTREAVVEMIVTGINSNERREWMFGTSPKEYPWTRILPLGNRVANTDRPEFVTGHPEHYRLSMLEDGRQYEVETVGGMPVCWTIAIGDIAGFACKSLPDWPMPRMLGVIRLRDGTLVATGGHRWVDTTEGLRARFSIDYPESTTDDVVESMVEHLAVEFNLWISMAKRAYGRLNDDLDDYLGGGQGISVRACGRAIPQEELLGWEVKHMRRALQMLRARLRPDQLEDLVGPETAESDRRLRAAGIGAETQLKTTQFTAAVNDLSLQRFRGWQAEADRRVDDWDHYVALPGVDIRNSDVAGRLLLHPERLRQSPLATGSRVVQALGTLPARYDVTAVEAAATDARYTVADPTLSYRLRDGTEIARVSHRYRETAHGFECQVTNEVATTCPDDVLQGLREAAIVTLKTSVGMAQWELNGAD